MPQNTHRPVLVIANFKLDIEHMQRDVDRLINSIAWKRNPGVIGRRSLIYVAVTNEELVLVNDRLQAIADPDSSGFDGVWCCLAPDQIVGRHGQMDPLAFRVQEAWVEARKRNEAQDVKRRQTWQRGVRRPIKNG